MPRRAAFVCYFGEKFRLKADGFEKVFAALNKERTDELYVSYSVPVMGNG